MKNVILTHEDYLKAMERLDMLYFVEDRTDEEDLEILDLSWATEDWEIRNKI